VGCPKSNSWSRDIYSGCGFTHSHQGNAELVPENRLELFPSPSFPIHHSASATATLIEIKEETIICVSYTYLRVLWNGLVLQAIKQ
jgi:hypothetical protein